jgi:hypothetical protein
MSKWTPSNTTTYFWINGQNVTVSGKGVLTDVTDLSGNSRGLSTTAAATRPTIASADLNGYDVFEFNGTTQYLESDDASEFNFESSDFAVFCLCKRTGSTTQSIQTVYDMGGSLADAYAQYIVFLSGVTDQVYCSTGSSAQYSISATDEYRVTSNFDNGAASSAKIDGSLMGTNGTPDTNYAASEPFTIGTTDPDAGSPFFLKGKIAEIIVVQGTLSDREIEQFEGYLRVKYALTNFTGGRFRDAGPAFGLLGIHNNDRSGDVEADISGNIVSDGPAVAI